MPPALTTAISSPSTSTCLTDPSGISSIEATRTNTIMHLCPSWGKIRLKPSVFYTGPIDEPLDMAIATGLRGADSDDRVEPRQRLVDGLVDLLPDLLQGDAVDDGLEEAVHQGVLRLLKREATALQVEELVGVDLAHGGAVGAAHVVGLDLELGHGIGLGFGRQDQAAVGLVGVRMLGVLADLDQPRVDRDRLVPKRAFDQQVAHAVGGEMVLPRLKVEVLLAVTDDQP